MDLSSVSLEDLKRELSNRGYRAHLKPYRPKREKCVCGRKWLDCHYNWADPNHLYHFCCPICGRKSKPAKTYYGAVDNWNKMVKSLKNTEESWMN